MTMEVIYDEENFVVNDAIKNLYSKHGYFIIRELFRLEEIEQMKKNYERGEAYHRFGSFVKHCGGNNTFETAWRFPGNDVFGMAARTQKLVETCAQLLGSEVYHFQSKIIVRHPTTGGQGSWYQDNGYLSTDSVPVPDLISAYITIDQTNKTNGCIQVLDGSHTVGKVKHSLLDERDKICADQEIVEELLKVCPVKAIELAPGDAIFLNTNILQKHEANTSSNKRMAFIPVYNKKSNSPIKKDIYPEYTPLDVVYNDAVLDCENYTDLNGKGFIDYSDLNCLNTDTVLFSTTSISSSVHKSL